MNLGLLREIPGEPGDKSETGEAAVGKYQIASPTWAREMMGHISFPSGRCAPMGGKNRQHSRGYVQKNGPRQNAGGLEEAEAIAAQSLLTPLFREVSSSQPYFSLNC